MAKPTENEGYQRLKEDIKTGNIGKCYILHGEEDYLRDYYLGQLTKKLVDDTFSEFNHVVMEGEKLDLNELESCIDSVPMMAERKLVVVKDFNFFEGNEEERKKIGEIISSLPDYICLIFLFDTLAYKPDGRMKHPTAEIAENVITAEFRRQSGSEMMSWVRRRFRSQGHDIDTKTTEYLMFLCGGMMTNLISEIGKICAYAKHEIVTREDIDTVATPVLDAVAFNMTDKLAAGDFDGAMKILGDLFLMRESPLMILGAVGSQMRNMYFVRLCRDRGIGQGEIAERMGKNQYAARQLISAVERRSAEWCRRCVKLCAEADEKIKQFSGDEQMVLETLLVKMYEKG